eukprot:TRINITY_DN7844_c0_g1_i3.p1 TRINITY_DN7844_c0_g1~~TRINITY_DN7844_c0_g1_i3.p1  ORF type:complete len:149 (+),score=13.47 TRINITY_DN7844_c0_g1_i3:107-553(+)
MAVNPLIHMIILNLANNTINESSTSSHVPETGHQNMTDPAPTPTPHLDLTERIVTAVGKTLALAYCIGLVLIILYYCYMSSGHNEITVSIRCTSNSQGERNRSQTRRILRHKDLPPSYDSIHFSDLPPHYEDVDVSYQNGPSSSRFAS